MKNLAARARQLAKPYRVAKGNGFRLQDIDPGDTAQLESADADRAREALQEGVDLLAEYQNRLYAQDPGSLRLMFQAMDALAELDLHHPEVGAGQRRGLAAARRELTRGRGMR